RMPKMCFDEILAGNDDLAKWCKERKNIGHFCCTSNKEVQTAYRRVANHVAAEYSDKPHAIAEFLKGADGWLLAHAMATGGFAVTEELRNPYKSKIKIPIVAKQLNCPWKSTPEMCKELKADFS